MSLLIKTETALKVANDAKRIDLQSKKDARTENKNMVVKLRYLDHLGVQALPHLRPTVGQQHRAVCVDMNQSSSLQTQRDKFMTWHKPTMLETVEPLTVC